MSWPSHGSNPKYIYEAVGLPFPQNYIDLSANINPLGPPEALEEKWNSIFRQMADYPDPHAVNLKKKIARMEKISTDSILIGNGGAELIALVGRMLTGKRVIIVHPTFSEYEQACRVNGCEIVHHHLRPPEWKLDMESLKPKLKEADAIFLCNPNNPTGVLYPLADILSLVQECQKYDCLMILDEAFYDFIEDYCAVIPFIRLYSNLIVLRSMTKMFAIPGIRLGYAVASPNTIAKLASYQPHWSVNGVALLAGEICLDEERFIIETQQYIAEERSRLFAFFEREGFITSPSKINFYLLKDSFISDQYRLFLYLLKRGIVPRHTFNFPTLEGRWLRLAIKSTDENDRLMEVLKEWRRQLS